MELVPDDTREVLLSEADLLYAAMRILRTRFQSGKHDTTAVEVRKAAVELISRARHPSRNAGPVEAIETDLREMRKP